MRVVNVGGYRCCLSFHDQLNSNKNLVLAVIIK